MDDYLIQWSRLVETVAARDNPLNSNRSPIFERDSGSRSLPVSKPRQNASQCASGSRKQWVCGEGGSMGGVLVLRVIIVVPTWVINPETIMAKTSVNWSKGGINSDSLSEFN